MTHLQYDINSHWPYDEALTWMYAAHARVQKHPQQIFLACGSHDEAVVTLGRDHEKNSFSIAALNSVTCAIRHVDRGGGPTAHEPGQLVLYPVIHTGHYQISPAQLIAVLEQTMIRFVKKLGLSATRSTQGPGVYQDGKKLGFVGLRIKGRVTLHGIAINLKNDASLFKYFDPCGIKSLPIGTVSQFVSLPFSMDHYAHTLLNCFISECSSLVNFPKNALLSSDFMTGNRN